MQRRKRSPHRKRLQLRGRAALQRRVKALKTNPGFSPTKVVPGVKIGKGTTSVLDPALSKRSAPKGAVSRLIRIRASLQRCRTCHEMDAGFQPLTHLSEAVIGMVR